MNIRSASFLTSSPDLERCPPPEMPEFAFIGRSNVGKSSLLNLLTRKKGLAKVSATPGKTQLINFFTINEAWRIVDLPGYGYTKGSKMAREAFQAMIAEYLTGRLNLSRVFILIDSRHSPQAIDLDFVGWVMEHGIPFQLVFTKSDKMKAGAMKKNIDAFLAEFPEGESWRVVGCSAKTGSGRSEILGIIAEVIA